MFDRLIGKSRRLRVAIVRRLRRARAAWRRIMRGNSGHAASQAHDSGVETIPEPTPESPLLSVHVPKAAGTSFRAMLEDSFGARVIFSYRNELLDPALECTLGRAQLTAEQREHVRAHCRDKGVRCIHGHFSLGRFRETFPDAPAITFLRDPIDRLLSEYWFQVNSDNIRHTPLGHKAYTGEWSMEEYLRRAARQWIYRKYDIEARFEEFDFIGITERFDESIELLRAKAPWLDLPSPANLNRGRHGRPELPAELRAELETLLEPEVAVYRRAVERLDTELARLHGGHPMPMDAGTAADDITARHANG